MRRVVQAITAVIALAVIWVGIKYLPVGCSRLDPLLIGYIVLAGIGAAAILKRAFRRTLRRALGANTKNMADGLR